MLVIKNVDKEVVMKIAKISAIQMAVRRACFLTRQFTGLEVMPEEMSAAGAITMAVLGRIWEKNKLFARKPESVINYAACMAAMEWGHAVRKDTGKTYSLDSRVISDQLDFMSKTLDDLFPGIMSAKNAAHCIYEGVCATAIGIEKNGWQWTKKLNEPITCLMSLYPILRALANVSDRLKEISEEFCKEGIDDGDED